MKPEIKNIIDDFVKSLFPNVYGRKYSFIKGKELNTHARSKKSCFAGYTDEQTVWFYDGQKFRQEEDCVNEIDYWATDGRYNEYPATKEIKQCLKEGDKFALIIRYSDHDHEKGHDLVQVTIFEIV